MDTRSALKALGNLSTGQWGLFTAAQAERRGVTRLALSRLAKAGLVERVAHGVYRDAGSMPDEFDDLRVAWVSVQPKADVETRLAAREADVVVSGVSAARLHGIGDLREDRFELTTATRRQSQRPDIRLVVRSLPREHVTVRHGLLVTTVERTLADLVTDRTDLTHVAGALSDALLRSEVDLDVLAGLLGALAARNGLPKGDGPAFVNHLLQLAGLDIDSTARRIAASPELMDALRINLEAMRPSLEAMQWSIRTAMAPYEALRLEIAAKLVPLLKTMQDVAAMSEFMKPNDGEGDSYE